MRDHLFTSDEQIVEDETKMSDRVTQPRAKLHSNVGLERNPSMGQSVSKMKPLHKKSNNAKFKSSMIVASEFLNQNKQ